ncbi:MAG: hypothetical protein EF813_11590 [Methanosarcinales archaeon]|nr:MAG: hypothetical protein EF813_11590 [Methanosarcinales archaeon]
MDMETIGNNGGGMDCRISNGKRLNMGMLITASVVLSIFMVLPGTVLAEDYPTLPGRFSDNVALNSATASVKTVIDACIATA